METVDVTGRVAGVTRRPDGSFGVTLGSGARVYWCRATWAPRVGQLVHAASAEKLAERVVGAGVLVVLDAPALHPVTDEPRAIDPRWRPAVQAVMHPRRPLKDYQVEGAAWLASRLSTGRGGLLADDPGLGKSAQAIAALLAARALPALIVCPKSLRINWLRELRYARIPVPARTWPHGAGGNAVIVCTYEALRRGENALAVAGFKAMVLDEAHLIKEPRPAMRHRAAAATRLARRIGRTLALTGSPMPNRVLELWRILHMTEPEAWPSMALFRERYAGRDAEMIAELRQLLSNAMLRRRKADVLDLPPKTRRVVRVKLDAGVAADYRAAEQDVIAWLRRHTTQALSIGQIKAEALVRLTALRKLAALGKVRGPLPGYLRAWLAENRRPLIIFAFHREVVRLAAVASRACGVDTLELSSTQDERTRQRIIDTFMRGTGVTVLCAPLMMAGLGLNLQRASDVLMVERTFTPSVSEQAEDRVHRIGQRRPVVITYLDAVDTIDERIQEVMRGKSRLIARTLGDGRAVSNSTSGEVLATMVRT